MKGSSDKPVVSVVMPVLDGAGTVASAIRSIVIQTYENWELIMIDDGSRDGSAEIARGFADRRIKVITDGKNQGIAARLNQAVDISRGQYVARMDADDVSFPNRFELQVEYLRRNPDIDLLGTAILVNSGEARSPRGVVAVHEQHEAICRRPWKGFYLPHPTWIGKRQWFMKYRYRSAANRAEDQDLLFRSYRNSRFACLPNVLLGYQDNRDITKMLKARYAFFQALFPEAVQRKQFGIASMLLLSQLAKAGGDFLNLKLGIGGFRNRLAVADPHLLEQWQRVLRMVNQSQMKGRDNG